MRVQCVGPLEELDAGQSRHPLVGDHQRDRIGRAAERADPLEALDCADRADDA